MGAAVTQPRAVAQLASTVKRLEDGDLKLRVRTWEVERLLERVELRQRLVGAAVGGLVVYQLSMGAASRLVSRALVVVALRLAWEARAAWAAMASLEEQRLRFSNQGSERFDNEDFYVVQSEETQTQERA